MGPPSPGQRPGSEILGSGEMRRSSGFFSAVGPAAPSLLLLLSLLLLSPDRGGAEAEHQRGTIVNMGERERRKSQHMFGAVKVRQLQVGPRGLPPSLGNNNC